MPQKSIDWKRYLKGELLMLVIVFLLFLSTSHKLFQMAQIRGWVGGATESSVEITEKWAAESRDSTSPAYWVSWKKEGESLNKNSKINTTKEHWDTLKKGDILILVRLSQDGSPYLRDGIYASKGNFIFDFSLLGIEFLGIIIFLILFRKAIKQHIN